MKLSKDKKDNKKNSPNIWKNVGGNVLIWILIVVMSITALQFFSSDYKPQVIDYTQFQNYVDRDMVASGVITGRSFKGTLKEPVTIESTNKNSTKEFLNFTTILPEITDSITKSWIEKGIVCKFEEQTLGLLDYIIQFSPWLLIIFFWFFLMRKMQGGGGQNGIFNFAKSRAKIISPDMPKTSFDEVAGCDEAKVELQEIVEFLKYPAKFKKLGAKIPRGALLLGPPGTGKTLLAKAVSGEANVPFFTISGAGLGGGHDEREQTLNQILVEMDGFETDDSVILLAATNRPDVLDKALLRPGRFDRQIVVDTPGVDGREAILKIHSKNVPMDKTVNFKVLAKGTPGLVGADLENLVNESALLAARKNKKKVGMIDFEDAKDKVMMGVERKSMLLTPEEKRITAIHEAGHALVAYNTKGADPVHKISIVPRGMALGITAQLPADEKHNYQKQYLLGRLDILMGGRCAEKLIFNDTSTGAGNDISTATDISRKMVCEWGMSDAIGPLTFGKKSEEVFLGREISHSKDYSDEISKLIDREISKLVKNAENNAANILTTNIEDLNNLADALLEFESISGEEMTQVIKGDSIIRKKAKEGKKRVRRRKVSEKTSSIGEENIPIIPKPAT